MKSIPGYYTPQEIRDRFKWTRQMLHTVAKRENWRTQKPYHTEYSGLLYFAPDVDDFALTRIRTGLLRQLGIKIKLNVPYLLIREKDYDMTWPECGAFAVWKPVDCREEINRDQMVSQPWICLNGHTGKTSFFVPTQAGRETKGGQ